MMVLSDCQHPLRVIRVDVEVSKVVFTIFLHYGLCFGCCWVKVENEVGIEIGDDDVTITAAGTK